MTIVVLSGRRVDARDAGVRRFPLDAVAKVGESIRRLFVERTASALVCSAACGGDLVALEQAAALGITRRVVLPFESARFRTPSVVDRPGDWGPAFDRVVDEVSAAGDLVVLAGEPGVAAYLAAVTRIA